MRAIKLCARKEEQRANEKAEKERKTKSGLVSSKGTRSVIASLIMPE